MALIVVICIVLFFVAIVFALQSVLNPWAIIRKYWQIGVLFAVSMLIFYGLVVVCSRLSG